MEEEAEEEVRTCRAGGWTMKAERLVVALGLMLGAMQAGSVGLCVLADEHSGTNCDGVLPEPTTGSATSTVSVTVCMEPFRVRLNGATAALLS